MTSSSARSLTVAVALLAEGVDRNFLGTVPRPDALKSPSSRRAWIEIPRQCLPGPHLQVALLAEGVDRNKKEPNPAQIALKVALLAEGVDRNSLRAVDVPVMPRVALLAEGVDRNNDREGSWQFYIESSSSRRAWIEISVPQASQMYTPCHPPRRGYG